MTTLGYDEESNPSEMNKETVDSTIDEKLPNVQTDDERSGFTRWRFVKEDTPEQDISPLTDTDDEDEPVPIRRSTRVGDHHGFTTGEFDMAKSAITTMSDWGKKIQCLKSFARPTTIKIRYNNSMILCTALSKPWVSIPRRYSEDLDKWIKDYISPERVQAIGKCTFVSTTYYCTKTETGAVLKVAPKPTVTMSSYPPKNYEINVNRNIHHIEVMVGIEVQVGEAAEAGTKPQDRTTIGKNQGQKQLAKSRTEQQLAKSKNTRSCTARSSTTTKQE
ncbi:unnamed protein product [Mytilus coruscus]|uniref:Uncharacterized protein n=1 Tax=Mytilus coruscus TaxID=42192 RepID=A0A6J8C4L8_MYTCO|nr:unnamed protein product [Mytilus coruscus]